MCRLLPTIFAFAAISMPASAQQDPEAGRRSYEVCAGCHGFVGEGNRLIGAPRLAGVESWYLERQILGFEAGHRGYDEADADGRRMALMAQAVESERELGDILAWIASLPPPATPAPSSEPAAVADASDRGRSLYASCSACHGSAGEGNEALGAPALVTLDDWYLGAQLQAYADGLRGTHPSDSYGAQMRAFASIFDTDEERQALVGFIRTLRSAARE